MWEIDELKQSKVEDLKRYIPDLTDVEIDLYIEKYWWLKEPDFLDKVCSIQKLKNTNYEETLTANLWIDQDFLSQFNTDDKLIRISKQRFWNRKIKNYIQNHSICIPWTNCISVFRQPFENLNDEDFAYSPKWLYFKDFYIELHPFLQRNEGFWIEFVECFWKYWSNWSVFQIAVWVDKIVCNDQYRRVELDKWLYYWKPYSDELLIANNKGVFFTKYIRDDWLEELQKNCIPFTEFVIDNNKKSIQIEEISEWVDICNRYIHCQFDSDKWVITHFDGSLLYYDPIEYEQRKLTTLDKNPRYAKNKEKVFRIDWAISISDWKRILYNFFYGNEMVIEYFDPWRHKEYLTELKIRPFSNEAIKLARQRDKEFFVKAIERNYERYWQAFFITDDKS